MARTENNPYTGACDSMRNRAVIGPLDSDAPAKAIATMRAESRTIAENTIRGPEDLGTFEPGAGEDRGADGDPDSRGPTAGGEPLRLREWMQRSRDRLDDQRGRIAALHREWEQTEVGAPGELRALVRLWELQTAYATTLRLDYQLRASVEGGLTRCGPGVFPFLPRSLDPEEA